jgi:hypothetical protein
MTTTGRALLIASPFQGLRGPVSDADAVATVLCKRGFEITRCYGRDATRDGIRNAWNTFIKSIAIDDAVVIYYSGHGGLVTRPKHGESSKLPDEPEHVKQWHYQFLVPVDYDQSTADDFRGILDVELSYLVERTTNKSRNVTVILDCCHAGGMARDPGLGGDAVPKSLLKVLDYHNLSRVVDKLLQDGRVGRDEEDGLILGNPHAVRVAAAAPPETAWEYRNARGEWTGALTEALVRALEEADGQEATWRSTALRVRELVNVMFPGQHPQIEGPATRLHFSIKEHPSQVLLLKLEDDIPVIQAGAVAGIRKKNRYSVMPLRASRADSQTRLAEATVTHVTGFRALTELSSSTTGLDNGFAIIPPEGALCFLEAESLHQWPVKLHALDPSALTDEIEKSQYLRICNDYNDQPLLVHFHQTSDWVSLVTNRGIQIAQRHVGGEDAERMQAYRDIVTDAEKVARAQHLLSLRAEDPAELLTHQVELEVGLVQDGQRTRILKPERGYDHVTEGDRAYIMLSNKGRDSVYVSVFDINVTGAISLISASSPRGIRLDPGQSHTIGSNRFGTLRGLPFSWPKRISKDRPVDERLLFILTNAPVDLGHLSDSEHRSSTGRGGLSNLEKVTSSISSGNSRDLSRQLDGDDVMFEVVHVPFMLCPLGWNNGGEEVMDLEDVRDAKGNQEHVTLLADLPSPASLAETSDFPEIPPHIAPSSKVTTPV